jgi:hypothetical protein
VKQSVFQDNRKMMLDMMTPMNQQLNEMRLLHENTKQVFGDLEKKIDELKRVLGMRAGQLAGGPLLRAPVNKEQSGLDPSVLQRGINVIKEQMKDVQREALQIETEMERRFSEMLNRNSQRKYLPRSLADEVHRDGEQASFQQIRAAITMWFGGPFDYARLQGELKSVQAELSKLRQEFKQQQLHQPEFKDKADRLPEFDFSMPIIPATSPFADQEQQIKVSNHKPKNLQLI